MSKHRSTHHWKNGNYLILGTLTLALGLILGGVWFNQPVAAVVDIVQITVTAEVYLPAVVLNETPTPVPSATPNGYPAVDAARENEVIALINQNRSSNTLNPLVTEEQLVQSARRHSDDMATHNNTSHTGTDGSTVKQRIEEAGYNPSWHGEIIAWGFPDAAGAVNWWMNSSIHRANILSTEAHDLGVGYGASAGDFGHYWVVNFGRRSGGDLPDRTGFWCTYVTGTAEQGSSVSFWSDVPCPPE